MRRELIFYDLFGRRLGRTGDISAMYFKKLYNGVGTFEAHFPVTSSAGKVLIENDFVIVIGDKIKAIVTGVTASAKEVTAYGRTLNWILGRRLCAPFALEQMSAASIAENRVGEAWEGCITVSPFGTDTSSIDFAKDDYASCLDIVTDVLSGVGLGHEVDFSSEEGWSFCVISGEERNEVIGSSLKNAADPVYTKDMLDYYSDGRIDGALQHSEKRSISDWDTAIRNISELEANHKYKKSLCVTAQKLISGVDYNLGDTIRVAEKICGVEIYSRLRIAGVEIFCEYNNCGEKPILEELL